NGDSPLHSEQLQYVEVLPGLWLDRFVSGNHEQHEINSANSRQHVAHEPLMSGNIDETDLDTLAGGVDQVHVCKTQIYGDPAALFLLQAVGIDARKSLYQRGFTVVDMSRSPDNDRFHAWRIVAGAKLQKWVKILRKNLYRCPTENATIEVPNAYLFDLCFFPGNHPAAWPHARRIRKDQAASGWP